LPINEEVYLLQRCLVFVFEYLERAMNLEMLKYLELDLLNNFPDLSHANHIQMEVPLEKVTQSALQLRDHNITDHLVSVLQNECSRKRFVDDMINQCQKMKF
jgi:hypothetical protein